MNLALWLERAGRSHPQMPAVGYGKKIVFDYGALALRTAKIAGALRTAGIKPGDRVAIASKNHTDYLALLFGIWHAGARGRAGEFQAAWRRAWLYSRAFRRANLLRIGRDRWRNRAACAKKPRAARHHRQPGIRKSAERRSGAGRAARRRRSRLAVLHFGHDREAQRRDAHPSRSYLGRATPMRRKSTRSRRATRSCTRPLSVTAPVSTAVPTLGRLGVNVIPESGSFEPDEIFSLFSAWQKPSMFAAPTMIKRLVESRANCDPATIRTLIWGGAPMYVEDALKAIDRFGNRLAQIYGQGESPMTISFLSKQDIAARDHPRWAEHLGSAGRPYACLEVKVADENDRCSARRRSRRNSLPRRRRDEGLLEKSGGDGEDAEGRLAAHRRCRRLRRRRLSHAERPLQRSHYLRRFEHLSARSRGGSSPARESSRSFGDRPAGSGMGRSRRRLCRWRRGARPISTSFVSIASRASSGRRIMYSSMRCPKTITARS